MDAVFHIAPTGSAEVAARTRHERPLTDQARSIGDIRIVREQVSAGLVKPGVLARPYSCDLRADSVEEIVTHDWTAILGRRSSR